MSQKLREPAAVVISLFMAAAVLLGNIPLSARADTSTTTTTTKTVTIYFQKPDSWSNAFIWYRSDDAEGNVWDTTVLGQAPGNMEPVPNRNGWYKKTVTTPNEATFLFNDGTWSNKLDAKGFNSSASGNNFTTTTDVWYTKDGTAHSTDPYVPTAAKASASPGSETFITDSVNVTLSIAGDNLTAAKYTVDGSDPKTSSTAVTFTYGTKITIGADLAVNSSAALRLYVKNDLGEDSETYTYNKVDESAYDIYNNLRIYQIMIASFKDGDPSIGYSSMWGSATLQDPGGDFQGIIDSLSYIKGTGVNAIWISPPFTSVGSEEVAKGTDPKNDDVDGNKLNATGYYTTDYFKVDPHFGTEAKLKELVTKAHDLGMYVFFDGVFGHCSANVNTTSPSGNKLVLRPGTTEYTNDAGGGNIDVASSMPFLKEVATYWMDEVGIDGWRVDEAYQVKRSQWTEINNAVQAKAQQRKQAGDAWGTLGYMVAEDWDGSRGNIVNNIYGPDTDIGLDSAFSFPVQPNFASVFVNGSSPNMFNTAFTQDAASYPSHAKPNLFIDNHDMRRFGNKLNSNGITPDSTTYWNRFKEAISVLGEYTGPVTMFYNTEIGAKCDDSYLNGWSGMTDDTGRFNAKTDYNSLTSSEKDLYNYTSSVMNLKANNTALWDGKRINLIGSDSSQVYADLKVSSSDDNEVLYVLNNSDATTVTIPENEIGSTTLTDGLTNQILTPSNGNYNISMSEDSARFLVAKVMKHSDAVLDTIDDDNSGVILPSSGGTSASSAANINVTVPSGYTVDTSKFTAKDNGAILLYTDSAFSNKLTNTVSVTSDTTIYVKVTSESGANTTYWSVKYTPRSKYTDATLSAIDSAGNSVTILSGGAAASTPTSINVSASSNYSIALSKFTAADNGTVTVYSDSSFSSIITGTVTVPASGKTVYVKVTSEDGLKTAYWSVTYTVSAKTITIYFQKPSSWSNAFIWYRSDDAEGNTWDTTVPGQAPGNMAAVSGHSGWYSKTVTTPNEATFLFNDGTWNNKLDTKGINSSGSGNNFTATTDVWISSTGTLSTTSTWNSQKTITIYFQKPSSWSNAFIWYRSDDAEGNTWDTTVPGQAPGNMAAVSGRNGWYSKTVTTPNEVTFLFNDGTWNNKLDTKGLNSSASGNNFTATTDVWISSTGTLSTTSTW